MEREGGNRERMRKCRESISLHFLLISSFSLHFLAARLQGCNDLCNPAVYIFFCYLINTKWDGQSFPDAETHWFIPMYVMLHGWWYCSYHLSHWRYVLKIHFFIESGLKMIQFKIQFKTKSRIFIQQNIHSIESRIFDKIIHS